MTEKVIGYFFVFLGVGVIFFATFNIYSVFTKKARPVDVFSFPPIALDLSQAATVSLPQELVEAGVEIETPPSQKQEIIPSTMLNQTSNLVAHLVLMGFIVNVGFKVAMLGTQMVRPVIVKVRPNEQSVLVPHKKPAP